MEEDQTCENSSTNSTEEETKSTLNKKGDCEPALAKHKPALSCASELHKPLINGNADVEELADEAASEKKTTIESTLVTEAGDSGSLKEKEEKAREVEDSSSSRSTVNNTESTTVGGTECAEKGSDRSVQSSEILGSQSQESPFTTVQGTDCVSSQPDNQVADSSSEETQSVVVTPIVPAESQQDKNTGDPETGSNCENQQTVEQNSSDLHSNVPHCENQNLALNSLSNNSQAVVGDLCTDKTIHTSLVEQAITDQASFGGKADISGPDTKDCESRDNFAKDDSCCDEVLTPEEVPVDVIGTETVSSPIRVVCETVTTEIWEADSVHGAELSSTRDLKSQSPGHAESVDHSYTRESLVDSKSLDQGAKVRQTPSQENIGDSEHGKDSGVSGLGSGESDSEPLRHKTSESSINCPRAGGQDPPIADTNTSSVSLLQVEKDCSAAQNSESQIVTECDALTASSEIPDNTDSGVNSQSTDSVVQDIGLTGSTLGTWTSKPAQAGSEPSDKTELTGCAEVIQNPSTVSVDDTTSEARVIRLTSPITAEEEMECEEYNSVPSAPQSPPVLVNRQVENVRSSSKRAKMSMSPNKGAASAMASASPGQSSKKLTLKRHTARKTLNPPSDRSLRVRRKIKTTEQDENSPAKGENQENLHVVTGEMAEMATDALVNGVDDKASDCSSPGPLKSKTLINVDHEVSFNVDTDNEESVNDSLHASDSPPGKHVRLRKSNSRRSSLVNGSVSSTVTDASTTDNKKLLENIADTGIDVLGNTNLKDQECDTTSETLVDHSDHTPHKQSTNIKSAGPKGIPKARKSCQPLPSKQSNSEKAKSQVKTSIANMTLRLPEIERSLGIKGKTLAEIDAKTLDRLILLKAQQRRNSLSRKVPKPSGEDASPETSVPINKNKINPKSSVVMTNAEDEKAEKSSPKKEEIAMGSESKNESLHVGAGISLSGKPLKKKKRRIRLGTYKLPGSKKNKKKMLNSTNLDLAKSDVSLSEELPDTPVKDFMENGECPPFPIPRTEVMSEHPCDISSVNQASKKMDLSSQPSTVDGPVTESMAVSGKTGLGMPKGGGVKKRRRRKKKWCVGKANTWKTRYLLHGQKTLDQHVKSITPAVPGDKKENSAVINSALTEQTVVKQEPASLDQVKASLDTMAARRSLRKRKATADSEDASSVVSVATSNAESDVSQAQACCALGYCSGKMGPHRTLSKQVKKRQKQGESCEGTPSSSPAITPTKNNTDAELLPPPDIKPPKSPRSSKSPGRTKSSFDDMIYTHPFLGQPGLMKQQIALEEGQEPSVADTAMDDDDVSIGEVSGLPSGAQQVLKFINTPNGVSYPVTPPKTPEMGGAAAQHHAAMQAQKPPGTKERDFIPLCLCRINGMSFTTLTGVVYCQALDSLDGKVIGCCNKINNSLLVRPAVKIPFMAVCETHRKRLRQHECCPGCGHFCTQGQFFQCKKEGGMAVHHFHRQCQIFKDNKYYCPHCGEESSQYEVCLKLQTPRQASFFIRDEPPTKSSSKSLVPRARMGFPKTGVQKTEEETQSDVSSASARSADKSLSTDGLPFGPDKADLDSILAVLNSEKPKKLRAGPKNIYHACKTNDLDKLVSLLGEGFDPNSKFEDFDNQTALHAASASGNVLLVHVLLQGGASPHHIDNSLRTPLMEAAENGHINVMKYLIRAGATVDVRAEDGMSTLHSAAKSGSIETIQFLLETKKIDVNVKDEGGWTPIIWASEHRYLDTVKFLLSAGADPNMRDNEENTALHWAAYAGSVDIAELFLNAGCDLESANEHGDRALHVAARQDHYRCVVLFLARGADSSARNNENETPISCCSEQNGQVWMALRVNRQLKGFANKELKRPERLLHRDISIGKESNPVPVVNDTDEENYPQDFVYVNENVETTPMNVNRCITSLQYCRCKDDCSTMFCVCGRNSVRCWYDKEGRLVKDFNHVEPPLVFECNKACQCWSNCQNRVVQLGITCRLQVFRTPGRGWGCRTLLDIPVGTFICEYIGEHISDAEADSREDDSYLFDLDNKDTDTFCIDARKYGNVSRFINHLCEPNLIPVKVFVEHQDLRFPRICFFASRDIKAMEELGFDYGEKFWIIKWKQFTCACASPKCKYSSETIHQTIEDYNRRQLEEEGDVE